MNLAQEALARKLAFAAWWQSPRAWELTHARLTYLHDLMAGRISALQDHRLVLSGTLSEAEAHGGDDEDAQNAWLAGRGEPPAGPRDNPELRVLDDTDDLMDEDPERIHIALGRRAQRLLKAATFYASEDMVSLVNAAYGSRPPEPLRAHHLIKPSGFMWLAQPALLSAMPDSDGWHVGFDAISWEERVDLKTGALKVVITTWLRSNAVGNLRPDLEAAATAWGEYIPWSFVFQYGDEDLIGSDEVREAAHLGRWAQTLWSLMQQPLVSTGAVPSDEIERHIRKRAHREDVEPEITVVTLRRKRAPVDPDHEPTTRNYSHRWIVRGFWRQQWYPKTEEHRPLWINDFIKGPEDRPFLVKERVYAFRR